MTAETPPPAVVPSDGGAPRVRWRRALLARREAFAAHPDFATAQAALEAVLRSLLVQLEPQCLGLYWPIRGEFNAPLLREPAMNSPLAPAVAFDCALPFAQRAPLRMHYRAWDGRAPALRDECGIPGVEGEPVTPDVVLVPCVGFTRSGHRLGYGAGYFDRWLAAHPHVTAVGVAWSFCELPPHECLPQPHDQPLMVVVTERGVVACD